MERILVAGATGLVGREVVEQLLSSTSVRPVALTRRSLGKPGLEEWLSQGDDLLQGLKDEPVDAVICCLGTTIKKAGTKDRFRYVDHDLVVGLARWAKRHSVVTFSIVSAIGADPASNIFYNKVKGEMERDVKALALPSLHIFHPSILTGPRQESRVGERLGIVIMNMVSPLLLGGLRRYRPMPHDLLASALIQTARTPENGTHVHAYDGIVALARKQLR